jgi:hypothetical protein
MAETPSSAWIYGSQLSKTKARTLDREEAVVGDFMTTPFRNPTRDLSGRLLQQGVMVWIGPKKFAFSVSPATASVRLLSGASSSLVTAIVKFFSAFDDRVYSTYTGRDILDTGRCARL